MDYCFISKAGNREINEDCIGIAEGKDCICFVVADGLGGHGKGDIASKLATSEFQKVFEASAGPSLEERLEKAFENAQSAILAEQQRQNSNFQMKTTVAAVAIDHSSAICGYIGDTSLVLFNHFNICDFHIIDRHFYSYFTSKSIGRPSVGARIVDSLP